MGQFDWLGKIPKKKPESNKVLIEPQIIEKQRADVATIPYGGTRYHGVYKTIQGNSFALIPQTRHSDGFTDTGVTTNTNYVSLTSLSPGEKHFYLTDLYIKIQSSALTTATAVQIKDSTSVTHLTIRPASSQGYVFHFNTPLEFKETFTVSLTVGTSNTVEVFTFSFFGFIEPQI